MTTSVIAAAAPELDWARFHAGLRMTGPVGATMEGKPAEITWRQGEHVAFIGQTGCGKTTLAYQLLPIRKYVVVLATKPKSPSLSRFAKDASYDVIPEWPMKGKRAGPRRILWPSTSNFSQVVKQREVIRTAFDDIYAAGGWAIYADELPFVTDTLKLRFQWEIFLMQGRELGVSVLGGMQRPKFVPLATYTNSTHLFFWRERDDNNLERISEINSIDPDLVAEIVTHLPDHQFLYVNSRNGYMCRSIAPNPAKGVK